jgi:hypothetical protein
MRSTQAPAGRASIRNETVWKVARRPTSVTDALRPVIATNGRASTLIRDALWLIASAMNSRRNPGLARRLFLMR